MYIIMLGAPGTGKGTIGKILSQDLELVHVSTGDMFREQINKKTELGNKIENYIANGELVPDDVTIEVVKARLLEKDVQKGAILDGFPRTSVQAQSLKEFLSENNPNEKRLAIELSMPDEDIIKRIVNRVTCSNKKCGAIYNTETKPPKTAGICDVCGSTLKKRDDDNEETVRKRLAVYHKNAKGLLDFYRENNALYSIEPKVLEETIAKIKNYLKNLEGSN